MVSNIVKYLGSQRYTFFFSSYLLLAAKIRSFGFVLAI